LKVRSPKAAPVATPEQRAAQEAFVDAHLAQDRLAQLKAEQRRIAAELKELKASEPNKLEREIAKQTEHPNAALVYTLRASLRGRILYGQSADEAIDAIVAQCRTLLETTPEDERVRKTPTPPNRTAADAE
jgi:hypothetical protein